METRLHTIKIIKGWKLYKFCINNTLNYYWVQDGWSLCSSIVWSSQVYSRSISHQNLWGHSGVFPHLGSWSQPPKSCCEKKWWLVDMVVVRRSRWQTWTPPLCSTACLAIHLGSAAPDLSVVNSFKWHCWSVVKHVALILILLLDLILLPGEAVLCLLLHLETEPTVPPEVEVGCLCWTLGGKILLSICSIYL